jgi:hypothetical protein
MGHDSIERLFLGEVTKYLDNDHRDPRVARVVREAGKYAAPATAHCD